MLNKQIFSQVSQVLGPFQIDLLASRSNAQCPVYCSWKPDPGSKWVNAFTLTWTDLAAYAFPPFILIARCLRKVREEKATFCLVTPKWTTQPWYAQALEMSVQPPILIPPTHNNLRSSQGEQHPLILNKTLFLIAWKVSGVISQQEDFRKRLRPLLPHLGGKGLVTNTTVYGSSFQAGAVKGKLIPFVQL